MQEYAACSIATSKEDAIDFMFSAEVARSIVAQLIMGASYIHSKGICHGGKFEAAAVTSHFLEQVRSSFEELSSPWFQY